MVVEAPRNRKWLNRMNTNTGKAAVMTMRKHLEAAIFYALSSIVVVILIVLIRSMAIIT
jgi:hypothetical protein